MLKLEDFAHLPQVKALVEQLLLDESGLEIVAGLDPRPPALPGSSEGFLPSGHATLFRILVRQIMAHHPAARATIVAASPEAIRLPASLRRRVQVHTVSPSRTYAQAIAHAARQQPDLLVVDRLAAGSAPAALDAAGQGVRVLSQLDTVLRGVEIARHLLDLGVSRDQLGGLSWIVTIQRVATLCSQCKEPASPGPAQLAELRRCYPNLELRAGGSFYRANGCSRCHHTGREGEITAFDIYNARASDLDPLEQPSLLALETYLLALASQGLFPLDDLINLEANRLRQTCGLLATSELSLTGTRTELDRTTAELEAANQVLQQRTRALFSLESVVQTLIAAKSLDELAAQLCQHARDLCAADRSILYFLGAREGSAEVMAECGWDPSLLRRPLDARLVLGDAAATEPSPFDGLPPGVPHRPTDATASALQAGLRVPLVVEGRHVGLMIVHTNQPNFAPGEVALLQTFASHAALAIQRAGLVQALREKIVQLQAAQAELVHKERMERELELAHQVQQSVLPRIFPLVPGYVFAARSEPARRVGGDFYDLIFLDAGRFGLVIGDVSDKGMPAALYMAQTHSLLRAEAHRENSPRAVLNNVHRLLQELGRSGMFVTVFYGIVESQTGRLTYARAGHDRPILLRSGEAHPLGGEGTILGFPDLDDPFLSEEYLDLIPGDRLVLYTDGLTDTVAPNGRPFGLDRLVSLLQSHANLPLPELCNTTFADLAAYQAAAEQYDDMTMLAIGLTEGQEP